MEEQQQKREPGRRQTVEIVELEPWGRGRLVRNNGPAFFIADSGEVVDLKSADWGGMSSNPDRSWSNVTLLSGEKRQATIIESGDDHKQEFSPIFGQGWLVSTKGAKVRFETDDGTVKVEFQWITLATGRPAYVEKDARSSKGAQYDDPDEGNWSTYKTSDGQVFTFRRGGPPPPAGTFFEIPRVSYIQLSPKARKAYDKLKKEHDLEKSQLKLG